MLAFELGWDVGYVTSQLNWQTALHHKGTPTFYILNNQRLAGVVCSFKWHALCAYFATRYMLLATSYLVSNTHTPSQFGPGERSCNLAMRSLYK